MMMAPFPTPPASGLTLGESLQRQGISRRALLKYASYLGALMALPATATRAFAEGLANARRQSVIWLSFQECTGCTESLTRAFSPTFENLIFDLISLDYHEALQAASGEAAEEARLQAMADNKGKYVVVVDGAVSAKDGGVYSTSAGQTNLDMLKDTVKDALAVVAVGSCASFGGIPKANPNPTGAGPASQFVADKPVINIPGCPPIAESMAGTIAYMISFGKLPELDHLRRPKAFYGETIHDRCYRRPFYERGEFAEAFDDEGARRGYCLYKVGCKGPVTYNSCATLKWNGGTSFPIQSGHGCLGCSEPDFWDQGGFYRPLSAPLRDLGLPIAAAGVAGVALGAGAAWTARRHLANQAAEPIKREGGKP
jgi:hydrogenase small subunit